MASQKGNIKKENRRHEYTMLSAYRTLSIVPLSDPVAIRKQFLQLLKGHQEALNQFRCQLNVYSLILALDFSAKSLLIALSACIMITVSVLVLLTQMSKTSIKIIIIINLMTTLFQLPFPVCVPFINLTLFNIFELFIYAHSSTRLHEAVKHVFVLCFLISILIIPRIF